MYLYVHEAAEEFSLSHGMAFSVDAGGAANLANIYEGGKSLCPRNLSDRERLDNDYSAIRAVCG